MNNINGVGCNHPGLKELVIDAMKTVVKLSKDRPVEMWPRKAPRRNTESTEPQEIAVYQFLWSI